MRNNNSFDGWSDAEVKDFLKENQFIAARKLESGEWIGVLRLMFTFSVCMDITPISAFAYRWCSADPNEAAHFYKTAKEYDEIPEIRTSLKGHRYARSGPLLVENDERGFPKW